jgi:transcriptional regulator with XRE-family HTH domain
MRISSVAADDRLRLADRVRSARRAAKLTQTGLADRVGVTPSAAAQWEHPHGTSPGVHRLQAIAAATGVTFGWLATGRGDQRRRSKQDDAVPALKLDLFAQDNAEESLLERFRMLSPRARQMLSGFLEEIKPGRR